MPEQQRAKATTSEGALSLLGVVVGALLTPVTNAVASLIIPRWHERTDREPDQRRATLAQIQVAILEFAPLDDGTDQDRPHDNPFIHAASSIAGGWTAPIIPPWSWPSGTAPTSCGGW